MRWITIAVVCSCLVIWLSSGCNKPVSESSGVSATEQEQVKIPPFVAGTWQMRDGAYRFVIEPNGVVSSADIYLMNITIRPHQTTFVKMKDGNVSDFTTGDLSAEYNPANRELFVFIELRKFLIRFFDIRTGGSQVDRFIGPVSEDGKTWNCEWISLFDYGPDLPQDVNEMAPSLCIFDKVEEYKPEKKPGG